VEDTRWRGPSGRGGYAFGPFVVDPVKWRLWRAGRLVPITAKTFHLLLVLLENRDRIVARDELLHSVWPNTAVHENNLARQVSFLRRALGQHPGQNDYIVTIPGHGYRFVASVQELAAVPPELQQGGDVQEEALPDPAANLQTSGSAGESVSDRPILEVATDEVASASLITPKGRRPLRWVLAVTGFGLLAAAVALVLLRPPGPALQPRRALQRITYDEAALPRHAAWAPDGQWVVFVSDRAGIGNLWKQRLGDPDPLRLTTSAAHASQPQWSPDGRSIVFRSERDGGGLYVIPASGGDGRMVASFGYEPRWSPDGTLVLFRRTVVLPDLPILYVVGLDGRPPRPVRPDVLGRFSSLQAAWHPDGRRVSIWGTPRQGDMTFLTVPLDGGSPTTTQMSARVKQDLSSASPGRFVWAPSRRYVYFEERGSDTQNVWRVTVDPLTENWVDGPERLTTGAGQETNVALSADGTRLLFTTTSSRTRLWAFPLDSAGGRITGEPYPISDGSTGEVDFDARADGSEVAYRTVRAGRNELWELSTADRRQRLVLSSRDWRFAKPRWSPDGKKLAVSRCAVRDRTLAVAILNADGSDVRLLTKPGRVDMQASDWSKDGDAILGACRFGPSEPYSTCLVLVPDRKSTRLNSSHRL